MTRVSPRPLLPGSDPHGRTPTPFTPSPDMQRRIQSALDTARNSERSARGIRHPGPWESSIPIIGSGWEAIADFQDGNYAGAALNGAMLVAELSPLGPGLKVARLVSAINKTRRAPLLASANTQIRRIRKAANVKPGYEVHHTIPIKGAGPIPATTRKTEGLWRNHPANMKILPRDIHQALHNGQYGPVRQVWHGTNALQKAGAASVTAMGGDAVANNLRPPPTRPPDDGGPAAAMRRPRQ